MEVSGQLHASATLSREREPGTNWIGGCVGPRAHLNVVAKESPAFVGNRTPVVQHVASSLHWVRLFCFTYGRKLSVCLAANWSGQLRC